MPSTAFVRGDGLCPVCGARVLNGVRCQWGVLPAPGYEVGDQVSWLRSKAGDVAPPFKIYQVEKGRWLWNCGDPFYRDVLLFDVLFDSDVFTKDAHCPNCDTPIAAGMAKVCDGVFEGIYALTDSGANSI